MLEPSPPAVHEGPWFADDPVNAPGEGRPVVSPIPNGGLTWDDLAAGDEELARWCADRWLGARRRLVQLPDGFASTREALHQLAHYVLAPARHSANTKIGLRFTRGGFGSPFFGA
ncbi:MAG: hypothetical protein ACRDVM_07020, partial [Acidimicrobiia bacterium]